jgi:pimeloyl-ACP methyl ester carboxylesterase
MSIAPIRRRKRRSNKLIQCVVAAVTAMAVANALIELAAPMSKQRLRRSKIRYIGTPEGDLCTQLVGDEPTALMLHDLLPGCSMFDFSSLDTAGIEGQYIAVDLLGYGRSDRPATKYDIAMHTDHVLDLLTLYPTITTIVAVGYSASIAINVANQQEITRTTVLVNPAYSQDVSKPMAFLSRVPVLGPFVYHMQQLLHERQASGATVLDDRFGNLHRSGSTNVIHGPQLSDLCESIVLPVDSDVHVIHFGQDDSNEGWNKVRGIVFSE